eukprot:Opistho-2@36581
MAPDPPRQSGATTATLAKTSDSVSQASAIVALVVGGGVDGSFFNAVQQCLRNAKVRVEVLFVRPQHILKTRVAELVTGGQLRAIIFAGENVDDFGSFPCPDVKKFILPWVRKGGVLMLQGMAGAVWMLQSWFMKPWVMAAQDESICRREYHLTADNACLTNNSFGCGASRLQSATIPVHICCPGLRLPSGSTLVLRTHKALAQFFANHPRCH